MKKRSKTDVCKCPKKNKLRNIGSSLERMLAHMAQLDYAHLDPESYLKLMAEVEPLFRFARKQMKKYGNDLEVRHVYAKALAAKLGGHIDPQVFLDPSHAFFTRFIESNALQHKMQTLKMRVEQDESESPLILVSLECGKSMLIAWDALTRRPILSLKGELEGYRFSYFEREVFCTDCSFKLDHNYILTYEGIKKYHPHQEEEIIAFDRQDPKDWGDVHALEIWTLLKDAGGDRPTIGIGDHCHIILKDNQGFVYSMGKFGSGRQFKFRDYLTLFAPKTGRFISPDFFSYYSETTRNLKKWQLRLTQDEFNTIFQKLEDHKKQKAPIFTLLKHNCASYVKQVLKDVLNLEVDTEIYLPHYALRAFLPKKSYQKSVKSLKKWVEKCPLWLQKTLYFIPILYIPMIFIGLIIRLLSLGGQSDYGFKDIFVAPWNMTIHHPIALRENLKTPS